eukprot:g41351.t1
MAQTVIPFVKGPEDRHFFTSFQEQDNAAFARWNPDAAAPDDLYPLAPHRREVQLLDSSSGYKSPGATADSGTRRIPNLAFYRQPAGECRAHTAIPIAVQETGESRLWNSKSVSSAAIRARVGGTNSDWIVGMGEGLGIGHRVGLGVGGERGLNIGDKETLSIGNEEGLSFGHEAGLGVENAEVVGISDEEELGIGDEDGLGIGNE